MQGHRPKEIGVETWNRNGCSFDRSVMSDLVEMNDFPVDSTIDTHASLLGKKHKMLFVRYLDSNGSYGCRARQRPKQTILPDAPRS